jgi:hypothetical protein
MDPATILARAQQIQAESKEARAVAEALCEQTRVGRRRLRVLVQARPARRLARLAGGGSDGTPGLPGDDGLVTVREHRCPICKREDTITAI